LLDFGLAGVAGYIEDFVIITFGHGFALQATAGLYLFTKQGIRERPWPSRIRSLTQPWRLLLDFLKLGIHHAIIGGFMRAAARSL
jgi:hypothetical protein